MKDQQFNLQKLANLLIIICLTFYILYIGSSIIIPFAFAGLFAFMLKPICDRLEQKIPSRILAIILSFLIVLIPLTAIIMLFSMQFVDVFENIPSITDKIQAGVDNIISSLGRELGMSKRDTQEVISEGSSSMIQLPFSALSTTLSISSNFIINFFLCLVYTFLLLLYRSSLKQFYLIQFGSQIKDGAETVLVRVQSLIQKYLYGLVLVMGILGVLNSIGLALIGIEYALFWGFLAAFLAIIPYIGTTLGGLLPFLYALATTGNYWQPGLVIALFAFVQFLEGNIITPKVVGSSIKINPLVAIIAMLIGGNLFGVAGLILAMPGIAIIRVIFHQIDFLKPVGVLLSDELMEKEDVFEEKFDKERFRIFSFFKKGTRK